jgi:hypothetical protein
MSLAWSLENALTMDCVVLSDLEVNHLDLWRQDRCIVTCWIKDMTVETIHIKIHELEHEIYLHSIYDLFCDSGAEFDKTISSSCRIESVLADNLIL